MTKEVNIRVKLPEDFSKTLDKWVQDLRQVGVHKTKSELVTKFAMIGFINEKRECDKMTNHYYNEEEA